MALAGVYLVEAVMMWGIGLSLGCAAGWAGGHLGARYFAADLGDQAAEAYYVPAQVWVWVVAGTGVAAVAAVLFATRRARLASPMVTLGRGQN